MSFDWQTEDAAWDDPAPNRAPAPPPRWQRLLPVLLLLISLALLASWLIRRQVTQRLDTVSDSIGADVETSARIVRQAAATGDLELLVTVLSGNDAGWAEAAQRQLLAGDLLHLEPFGLRWRPDQTSILTFTVSADLLQADVQLIDTYEQPIGNGEVSAVRLVHHETYRRGSERWLLAPSESDGTEMATYEGQRLQVRYPEDEALVVRPVAIALDGKLTEACGTLHDLDCPPTLALELRPEAALLTQARAIVQGRSTPDETLALPSPAVVGLPADATAARALYRAYARLLLASLLATDGSPQCCAESGLFEALVEQQLVELGLAASPVQAKTYSRLLADPVSLRIDTRESDDPATPWIRDDLGAVIAFVRAGPAAPSLPRLVTAMAEAATLADWVDLVLRRQEPAQAAWLRHLAEKAGAPFGLPSNAGAGLVTLCSSAGAMPASTLYAHFGAGNTWEEVLSFPGLPPPTLAALPGSAGVLILETPPGGAGTAPFVWFPGQPLRQVTPPPGLDAATSIFLNQVDGDWLFFTAFDPTMRPAGILRLDASRCMPTGCALDWLSDDRYTTWAPKRGHSLVLDAPWPLRRNVLPREIRLTAGDGQVFGTAGAGSHPFWLDDQRYGFVRADLRSPAVRPELVVANVEDREPAVWVTSARLHAVLPPVPDEDDWQVANLWTAPGGASLVLDLRVPGGPRAWVTIDVNGQPRLIADAVGELETVTFSPDGEQVVLGGVWGGIDRSLFLDLATGERRLFSHGLGDRPQFTAWSPSHKWLAVSHDHYTTIHSASGAAPHVLASPEEWCEPIAWVNHPETGP